MGPTRAALFQLLSTRLRWLAQRQVVLGQNLANADTPDFRPRDLNSREFARVVRAQASAPGRLAVGATHPDHLDGLRAARLGLAGREVGTEFESAPDGNAVVLEEQMAKLSASALDYQLASNLYRKYVGMVRIALGTEA